MNEEITVLNDVSNTEQVDNLEEASLENELPQAEQSLSDDVSEIENSEEISDEQNEQDTISMLQETIASLKEQITSLEREREMQEKVLQEVSDFSALFPAVDIDCIPECVWESVKKGTSLAASYALYERRMAAQDKRIEQINSMNSLKSAGVAGKNTASEFFTPDDVRKMSRAEVHANFTKIRKSMEKWN